MPTLGIGKTLFNSSVCYFEDTDNLEVLLTERLTRKKASGAWPSLALETLRQKYDLANSSIYENRDVEDPFNIELAMNSGFPFFEYLKKNNLDMFSRHFNQNIIYCTHHLAHAHAAAFMSPFSKTLILVIDGAGSRAKSFSKSHAEYNMAQNNSLGPDACEERTLYTFDSGRLVCVDKKFQVFKKSKSQPQHHFSRGLGSFYEKISEFIFNSKRSAGKVMGLAALGEPENIADVESYLENLNWTQAFNGNSKKDWETSVHLSEYKKAAATAQAYFEKDYLGYIKNMHSQFSDYKNLIITGGCALNCTSNMKLYNEGMFESIYIPPFPGDESIGLGTAYLGYLQKNPWKINPYETQHGYFGPISSTPEETQILKIFDSSKYEIILPDSIAKHTAQLIADGQVVAWFQGRSESGPRALGNRSILCRPDKVGAKDYLNKHIKFRESFRPYGSSVTFEKAHLYFEVPENFNNPYMSFATLVKSAYQESLKEVTHLDGTSRMQTVRKAQNETFYELINEFGKLTDLYCILNTSLNIMGQPIVETIKDAEEFLNTTPVHGLAIGKYYIKKL